MKNREVHFNNPQHYSQNSTIQYNFSLTVLNNFLQQYFIAKDAIVLDIGCGTGELTRHIAENIAPEGKVIGIDISPSTIEFASDKHFYEHLSFQVMSADAIKFDAKFDFIASFFCLHWVMKQLEMLQGVKEHLKEEGKILFLFPMRTEALYACIESIAATPKWEKYFQNYSAPRKFFTKPDYLTLLEEAKLNPLEVVELDMTEFFDSKKSLCESIKAWLPHAKRLPTTEDIDEFVEKIVETYLEKIGTNNYQLTLSLLKIVAANNPNIPINNKMEEQEMSNNFML